MNVLAKGNIQFTNIYKGNQFVIKSITCDTSNPKGYTYQMEVNGNKGKTFQVELAKVKELPIECNMESKNGYWYSRTIKYSLPSLSRMNDVYSFRTKAEAEATKGMVELIKNKEVIEDPLLSSYINSLLYKINPDKRLDNFKYNNKVVVVKSAEPNACIWPNGMLMINAGMLARLSTEDELVALLSHEMNHFICNHYLENINKEVKKQTAVAIASFLPVVGGMIATTAIMVEDMKQLLNTMGLAFDQTQEIESDEAGMEMCSILGYDRNAMATCIKKIGDYYIEEGNLAAYYKSGSHPRIEDRIAATGKPYDRRDAEFEKKMASCISFVSQVRYGFGRYSQAMEQADKNINNGVGRGIDYYIKGECLLASQDTEESNTLARESLLKARETFADGLPTLKALIISDIRLGKKEEAMNLLCELKELAKDNEEELLWAEGTRLTIAN